MIRSYNEDDITNTDNSFDFILRPQEYKDEIYKINEEIKQNINSSKLYGYNIERKLNIVITKVMNIYQKENSNLLKRLLTTIKLIEENNLLVENLWIEKINTNNYSLYVSELTNTIYRNEYNLITLNNYMSSTKNTYKDNIQILILIVKKMLYYQKYNFSHLNIHPNNIYINTKNKNLIYFGPPKLVKNYINDSTYSWYSSPEESIILDEFFEDNDFGVYNDIWSLGCIICELFFINFPLFQSDSNNEKIMKIIDCIGFPEFKDVDYMNKYQYDSLYKQSLSHSKENNLFDLLLSSNEEHTNLYNFKVELIDIIKNCLLFNPKKRIKLENILQKLEYLNNNISNEFHSKIIDTINITEESEKNNFNYKSKFKYKGNNILYNKSLDSSEPNDKYRENNNINIKQKNILSLTTKNNNQILYNEFERNNIKYKNDNDKKNIMDYFKEVKKKEEKDEYSKLYKGKFYIIYNFSLLL